MWGALIGAALNYLTNKGGPNTSAMADPFASQRGQYMGMLQNLMTRGMSPNDPAYQFRLKQGTENLQRSALAGGGAVGGGTLAELMKYGQGLASQEYGNQFNRLAELSGVGVSSPVAAAKLAMLQQQQQATGAGILGTQLWNTLAPLWGGSTSGATSGSNVMSSGFSGSSTYS